MRKWLSLILDVEKQGWIRLLVVNDPIITSPFLIYIIKG